MPAPDPVKKLDALQMVTLAVLALSVAGIVTQRLVSPRPEGSPYGGYEILGFALAALTLAGYGLSVLADRLRRPRRSDDTPE